MLRNVTCEILCYCLLGSISFLTPSQHVSHLNTFDLLCQTLLINGWKCGLWRDLVFWSFSVQCSTCRIFFGKLDASILEVSSSISSMAKRAAGQLPDVHRNDSVAQITAKTLQKQMWWKKPARCPRFHWDLQKIVVLLQRQLRFLFLHLWKFRTVLGGLDKMKCTCRCGKTVIFVDHNSSELRFQKKTEWMNKKQCKLQWFHVWTTCVDLKKAWKRYPGFRAVRMFMTKDLNNMHWYILYIYVYTHVSVCVHLYIYNTCA